MRLDETEVNGEGMLVAMEFFLQLILFEVLLVSVVPSATWELNEAEVRELDETEVDVKGMFIRDIVPNIDALESVKTASE